LLTAVILEVRVQTIPLTAAAVDYGSE